MNKENTIQPLYGSKFSRIIVLIILCYEALGGLLGGSLLIAAPDGRLMDMPVEMMHGVFKNFLIPGIILFAMGVLNAVAFVAVLKKKPNDWILAGLAMDGFIIWFVVEIVIIRELHWLHLMWGLPVVVGSMMTVPLIRNDSGQFRKALLYCGILSSLYYILINTFVPFGFEGYSFSDHTVSELSALGAPTRIAWVLLATLYVLLFSAFGWGVLRLFSGRKYFKIIGVMIICYSIFNMYWPPMHLREYEPTLTDTLHITWTIVTISLMILIMSFGAAAMDRKFRIYTIISIALHILFGSLTGRLAPNIPENLPTPGIGVYERINIFIFMLWVIVFAVLLLRSNRGKPLA